MTSHSVVIAEPVRSAIGGAAKNAAPYGGRALS